MNRTEALNKLQNEEIIKFLQTREKEIEVVVTDSLCVLEMLKQIELITPQIKKVQKNVSPPPESADRGEEPDYKIKYLQFSYLRSGMVDKKITILLQAFDEKWHFDHHRIERYFDFTMFQEILDELYDYLLSVKNMKIEDFDIQNLMTDSGEYLAAIAFLSFKTYLEADQTGLTFMKEAACDPDFEIWGGEYKYNDYLLYNHKNAGRGGN